MSKTDQKAIQWMKKFLRYTDYIGAAQLYLKENVFLKEPLKAEHFKSRILGHWGTVPGINFIYANLNYLIWKHKCEMLLIAGPGHGAPAVLANLFAEGTLKEFYPEFPTNAEGTKEIIKSFSWPHSRFPSHVTPSVPGSILEGGELGYSLSTAFGAALDNKDLIVSVIVGDGEAETGPLSAAWHSNKFLNPATSGAVLPIVHINGYKISNPTIYGTMSNEELTHLFKGYGYEPLIVEGKNIEQKMINTLEKAYQKIRDIQKTARKSSSQKPINKPIWPVILLRTIKGWKGVHEFKGTHIEGSFRSHGVPIDHPNKDKVAFKAVEKWLLSYKINELIDKKGRLTNEITKFIPSGKYRLGMNKHAIGGNFYTSPKIPNLSKYAIPIKENSRGEIETSNIQNAAKLLRDIIKANPKNFRILCPDELESNKLTPIFEATKRAYMWPIKETDENISPNGRVMEMLSEHTLQGWYQGYLLTGRHGIFATYEAFAPIISSMVDQYAKFIKQALRIKWRKPIGTAIYLLTSLGWRQDHNGFSHQNPGFVSNILQKHGKFCQIYYPVDVNSLLVAYEETLKRKNSICAIVSGKTDLPQWLTLKEARAQAKEGMGIWEWVGGREGSKDPDVVLASAGDYLTQEALLAVKLCKALIPELKIRYVNISELTALCLGDTPRSSAQAKLDKFLTKDKPVIINYHGYTNDIEQILWPYENSKRFIIHGYNEEGSTTTPFDLKLSNGVSRYHLLKDLIEIGARTIKHIRTQKNRLLKDIDETISSHRKFIETFGSDPPEIDKLKW